MSCAQAIHLISQKVLNLLKRNASAGAWKFSKEMLKKDAINF